MLRKLRAVGFLDRRQCAHDFGRGYFILLDLCSDIKGPGTAGAIERSWYFDPSNLRARDVLTLISVILGFFVLRVVPAIVIGDQALSVWSPGESVSQKGSLV
jgi:hypothetical protein